MRPLAQLRPFGRPRTAAPGRAFYVRRAVLALLLLFVSVTGVSYASAMASPSNVSFGVRSVEWLRTHGMAWLVADGEQLYYSWNAPKQGGPGPKMLPRVGIAPVQASTASYMPPSIAPAVHPALPGEGQWQQTGAPVAGQPPVLVTTFRPDPSYPDIVAGVAWIDHSRTQLSLFPGRYQPPSASPRGPMEVPPELRSTLIATFNSGFTFGDSGDGFATLGHTDAPLRSQLATVVGYRDGRVDVLAWNGGSSLPSDMAFARQNLRLIVNAGQLNPNLSDGPQWGATLKNATRVWRSGIGVDRQGNLMYAAAPSQTVKSLAQILQRAGAVRAMELDINTAWISFNTYSGPGAVGPQKLLPNSARSAERFLTPDDRDFFAVNAKSGP